MVMAQRQPGDKGLCLISHSAFVLCLLRKSHPVTRFLSSWWSVGSVGLTTYKHPDNGLEKLECSQALGHDSVAMHMWGSDDQKGLLGHGSVWD